MNTNQNDSAFKRLFSEPQKLLALYNALSGSDYPPDTQIEITVFERTNDIGLLINKKLFVIIALRSAIDEYILFDLAINLARFYEKFLGNSIYSKNLVKIPRPEFLVLYNGEDDFPDEDMLKLSDDDNSFKLEAKVVNIRKNELFKDFDLGGVCKL